MNEFGCLPPSVENHGPQICKNVTGHVMPMRTVDSKIDCPKPCKLFKVRAISHTKPQARGSQGTSTVKILFNELVTISTDQYSYTWLNLVAEVGGYVGLFLGYSVFQMTDLMEVIIQRVIFPRMVDFRHQLKNSMLRLINWL